MYMGEGEKVIGYVRVSTETQGTNGVSLEAQQEAIEAECKRRGWTLLRVEQDVQSGKSTRKRPGLERALSACRSGEASGIVVSKLDRLSRSVVDAGQLLEEARQRGFNIVALDFGLDFTSPQGELVANVLTSVAQWERRIIGQRTKEALAVKRAQGIRLGRPVSMDPKTRQRIVRERKKGKTLAAIAEGLNKDGVPTAQGGKRWYPSTVSKALG